MRHGWAAAPRPLLLGHRGCRGAEKENTLAAFDRALAEGCDGFEFDVRRSLDGRSVICHDPQFRGIDIAENEFDSLKIAPLRSRFGIRRRHQVSESLLCLEEVLERYGSRAFMDIELKVDGLEEATLAAIQRLSGLRGYVISSFLPSVVRRVHELDARAVAGYIFNDRDAMALWSSLPCAWVMPHYKLVTPELVHEFHDAGKHVMAWTVNNPGQMRRLAEFGVDALIADDPRLLRDVLGSFVPGTDG